MADNINEIGVPANESILTANRSRTLASYDHPHWNQFYESGDLPAPLWMHMATGVYVLVVAVLGTIGNAVLLLAFLGSPSLRSPSNMLVANLAFADFGLNLFAFPLLVISSFKAEWVFGQLGCNYYVVSAGFFGLLSILTMTSISFDRYCSITRWASWHLSYSQVFRWVATLWTFAFALIIPPLFGWSQYVIEGLQTSCSFDWLTHKPFEIAYVLYLTILGFFLPLVIIFVCYALIIRYLIRHRQVMNTAGFARVHSTQKLGDIVSTSSQCITNWELRDDVRNSATLNGLFPDKSLEQRQAIQDNDVKAATTCAIIVVLFMLAWGPYTMVALIGVWGNQNLVTPYSNALPVLFAKTSAVYNPIVYALMNERFRSVIWSFIKHGMGDEDGRSSRSSDPGGTQLRVSTVSGRPKGWLMSKRADSTEEKEMLYLNVTKQKKGSFSVPLADIPETLHSKYEVVLHERSPAPTDDLTDGNAEARFPLLH